MIQYGYVILAGDNVPIVPFITPFDKAATEALVVSKFFQRDPLVMWESSLDAFRLKVPRYDSANVPNELTEIYYFPEKDTSLRIYSDDSHDIS